MDAGIESAVASTEAPVGRASVDYVLRTAQQNLLQLSSMADQKASVVRGAAFVTATIVFGDVSGSDDLDAVRVSLLLTALLSGLCAAVALAPRLVTRPARDQPLFFGSIARLDADEYRATMRTLLADDQLNYDAIIDDLHAASSVLVSSKFRPLQLSYFVLVIGMATTLVMALVT